MTSPAESTGQVLQPLAWWEIPVTDVAAASEFFTAVLGWTYTPFGEDYLGINNGAAPVGGLYKSDDAGNADGIKIYIDVPDMEATLAKVEAAGGTVRKTRTAIGGDMGWWAEIAEPGGRGVSIWTGTAEAS